jgi:IMP dehydrogenase
MIENKHNRLSAAYGFDDISIAPGSFTINPDQTQTTFSIGTHQLEIPIIASAMDAIVSTSFAVDLGKLGGLAVLNLEGVISRYPNPQEAISRIINSQPEEVIPIFQDIYSHPINNNLIGDRISEIKSKSVTCAVSITPANTKRLSPLAIEAGADILCVQSTVTTARHESKSMKGLVFSEFLKTVNVPVIVGNCVSYETTLELMETGIDGILVGIGPGAACTTREVTGVGVPQVTATLDCSSARDEFHRRTGKYVPIITDGGIKNGGDLCKAIASGADAVMIGTPFAQSSEAPGGGYNWGMATPHPALPRGTRIEVGVKASLQQILFGPSSITNGTMNLIGALKACMGMVGAYTIQDMHRSNLVLAPSIKTEGKHLQINGYGAP